MRYHLAGMTMSAMMVAGMVLVAAGFRARDMGAAAAAPRREHQQHAHRGAVRWTRPRLTRAHWGLMLVLALALVIDTMKPATLGFVLPGMSEEYGFPASRGAWLLLCASSARRSARCSGV
jgi:putative MFS transporter